MLHKFYDKIGRKVPQVILDRFTRHDETNNFAAFEDPKTNQTTQTAENPQAINTSNRKVELSESEIAYQI